MTDERITEIREDDGPTNIRTTIIRDIPERKRGFGGVLILLLALAAIAALGLVVFSQMSTAETARDNASAGAAEDVGNAANQVGNAVEEGVDRITE